jgi:hypothetical protein
LVDLETDISRLLLNYAVLTSDPPSLGGWSIVRR